VFSNVDLKKMTNANVNGQAILIGQEVSTILHAAGALMSQASFITQFAGSLNRVGELLELLDSLSNSSGPNAPFQVQPRLCF
jgi:hypothetical protein